jgi:ribonuclease PH
MKQRVERQIGDQVLAIETGLLAKQAAGSVLVSYGDTRVLVAAATGAPRGRHRLFSAHLRLPRAWLPPASFPVASSSVRVVPR